MKKAILDSKWYWYVSLVWVFYIHQMSKWCFEPESYSERVSRSILTDMLMFPTIIFTLAIIIYFKYF